MVGLMVSQEPVQSLLAMRVLKDKNLLFVLCICLVCQGFRRLNLSPMIGFQLGPKLAVISPNSEVHLDGMTALINKGIVHFIEQFGNCPIPSNFVVPNHDRWPVELHGLRLGYQLYRIMQKGNFASTISGITDKFQTEGFISKPVVSGWDIFYDALLKFKAIHGHVSVPDNYVIPKEIPWTNLEWGMKLGLKVSTIRTTRKHFKIHQDKINDLIGIGFEFNSSQAIFDKINMWSDDTFCRLVAGLQIYRDNFPDQDMHSNFVVPETIVWPKELHNMKLGAMVHFFRQTTQNRSKVLDIDVDQLYRAVKIYKSFYPSSDIPPSFVVPISIKWPSELWEYALGPTLSAALQSDSIDEVKRDEIVNLIGEFSETEVGVEKSPSSALDDDDDGDNNTVQGFDFDDEMRRREKKSRHLLLLLNSRIASRDGRVRKAAHYEGGLSSLELSRFLFQVPVNVESSAAKTFRYRSIEFGRFEWSTVFDCFKVFRNKHGHLDIPESYIINPSYIDGGYPADALGLDLWDAATSIRMGDVDALDDHSRKSQLDSLHFHWGNTEKHLHFRFVPTWLGLKHFIFIHGHNVVEWDFAVPCSEEWPSWMIGMPLGRWYWTAKTQHILLAGEYPDRKELLDTLDIDWHIPIGMRMFLDQKLISKLSIM